MNGQKDAAVNPDMTQHAMHQMPKVHVTRKAAEQTLVPGLKPSCAKKAVTVKSIRLLRRLHTYDFACVCCPKLPALMNTSKPVGSAQPMQG